ncbi:MAG: hypothetical protein IKF90_11130 [Parasporobacterium sp.]|nr:hypothetical protein [Parasporobacterium sp.]
MWKEYNPNPVGKKTGDCSVRAVAKALDVDWDTAHDLTSYMAKMMGTIQNENDAWGAVLRRYGFIREVIPNYCPDCYAAEEPDVTAWDGIPARERSIRKLFPNSRSCSVCRPMNSTKRNTTH